MDPGKNEVNNENIKTEENVKTKQDLGGEEDVHKTTTKSAFSAKQGNEVKQDHIEDIGKKSSKHSKNWIHHTMLLLSTTSMIILTMWR